MSRPLRGSRCLYYSTVRGLLIGTKELLGFFDTFGGNPLLAPEGVSTMMGHSWYSLLTSKFRSTKKVNYSRERSCSFMHSFIRSWYRIYMGT